MRFVVDDENAGGGRLHRSDPDAGQRIDTVAPRPKPALVGVHVAAGELDESLDDIEPEPRPRCCAPQLVAEPMELLEDHLRVLGRKAEPVVADGQRDAARVARAADLDRAALGRDARLQRVVEQVAQPRFDDDGVDGEREIGGDVERDRHAARAGALRDRGDRGGARGVQIRELRRQALAPFLEPRGVEQIVDHAQEALAVLENARSEPFAVVVARAQHERFGRELDARKRALELVRHGGEEVLLPPPQLGVVPQRARQHGHAADQHDEKEAAFPEDPVDARVAVLGDGGIAREALLRRCARTARRRTSTSRPVAAEIDSNARKPICIDLGRVAPYGHDSCSALRHSDSAAAVWSAARKPSASLSMSRRVCASDRNAISNADGASAMP